MSEQLHCLCGDLAVGFIDTEDGKIPVCGECKGSYEKFIKKREGRRKTWNCHDCGVKEGELHKHGCDMERCPFCGTQLITCRCCYEKLGLIDKEKGDPKFNYLPENIWSKGLTDEQNKKWKRILEAKGRIRYLLIPVLCALCGEQFPKGFNVPDEEWNKYVPPELQPKTLCRECYDELKQKYSLTGGRVSVNKR